MKLTTKRNRWFFWREFFSYMIPTILIVGTVDVFVAFMNCSIHSVEWSAPCSLNWIGAALYGVFLLLAIIFAIISAKMLRKIKKKIEDEFTESINNHVKEQETKEKSEEKKIKATKLKKVIAKANKETKTSTKK